MNCFYYRYYYRYTHTGEEMASSAVPHRDLGECLGTCQCPLEGMAMDSSAIICSVLLRVLFMSCAPFMSFCLLLRTQEPSSPCSVSLCLSSLALSGRGKVDPGYWEHSLFQTVALIHYGSGNLCQGLKPAFPMSRNRMGMNVCVMSSFGVAQRNMGTTQK